MSENETGYKPGGFIPRPQRVRLTAEDFPLIRSDKIDTSAVTSPEYREWAAKAGDRVVAPNEAARAIVQDFALVPPAVLAHGGCAHCGADLHGAERGMPHHREWCVWRRAVEWVRDTGDTT